MTYPPAAPPARFGDYLELTKPRLSLLSVLTALVGYLTVPPNIKRAALMVAVDQLTKKNLSNRTKSYSDETGSYDMYLPGNDPASVYGLPEVRTILNNYAEDPLVAS